MDEKDEARELIIDLRGPDVTVYLAGVEVNASPEAFHIYAGHYYKCKQDFKPPDDYPSMSRKLWVWFLYCFEGVHGEVAPERPFPTAPQGYLRC